VLFGDRRFGACFVVILLATALNAYWVPAWEHATTVLASTLVAGVAWYLAMQIARGGKGSLLLIVLGAILLRSVGLATWPDLSDDIYRYAWEAELVVEGVSPYAYAPDSSELGWLKDRRPELFARMNNTDISAAYPPLTQAACALVVAAANQFGISAIFLLRAFFTICDLLVLWPLCILLGALGVSRNLCVTWAWCPLVLMEFSGSGHFDSFGILLLISALALFASNARVRASLGPALLAGAIVVKYIPLAALPFAVRKEGGWRRCVLVLILCAAAFVPLFWMEGAFDGLFHALGEYGLRWQSSGLVHPYLAELVEEHLNQDGGLFDARRVTRILLAGAWFLVAAIVWRRKLDAVQSTGILLGAFLILTPTLHPWYVTWIIPFIALRPRASWCWLVLTIPCYYQILEGWKQDGTWELSPTVRAFVALPFALLLCYEMLRSALTERTS
jgi:hypothetical protein